MLLYTLTCVQRYPDAVQSHLRDMLNDCSWYDDSHELITWSSAADNIVCLARFPLNTTFTHLTVSLQEPEDPNINMVLPRGGFRGQ